MKDASSDLRDRFWAGPPALPEGLVLERVEPIPVTRPGRGGTSLYDAVDLVTPTARVPLLVAYQTRLLASHVNKHKQRLVALAAQRRERQLARGAVSPPEAVPALVTDIAKPSVITACRRAGLAVVDQKGSVVVSAGGVFVAVEGKGSVERPWRGRLFSGKASRVVRYLLTEVAFEPLLTPRSTQAIAAACDLSYVYAYSVLTKLERDGFVRRESPRSGFVLHDVLGLLRAWVSSDERTAVAVEGFYAPATDRVALLAGAKRLEATGNVPLFSLLSALEPDEIHVAGLPHGAYWTGELAPLVEAFRLQRKTPHNFLVMRPDPLVWTAAGGLLVVDKERPDPRGSGLRRVALPQLIADLSSLPGRGKEEADFLVGLYANRLPYHEERA